jgi:ribose transport system permease protein
MTAVENEVVDAAVASERRPAPGAQRRSDRSATVLAERYSLLVLLALVVVFFGIWHKTSAIYPTHANLDNVVGSQSVAALVAIATVIPLVCGQFDLSLGAVLGVSAMIAAKALSVWDVPLPLALTLGVAVGAAVGAVNGYAVAHIGVNSLIVTLAVATILSGVTSWISNTPIVSGIPTSLTDFGSGDWIGLPSIAFVLLAIAIIAYYILEHTPFGRELHAIGSNRAAARLVGVSIERRVWLSFVLAGAVAGLAGVLQLARSGSGDPAIGSGFTLPAVAAAFLGATSIRPGRFNVWGTFVAVFFLAAIVSGLTISGAQAWLQDVVNGGALAIGIVLSTLMARRRARA